MSTGVGSCPMTIKEFKEKVNEWGHRRIPFLFLVDFEMNKPVAIPLDQVASDRILYAIGVRTNAVAALTHRPHPLDFEMYPLPYEDYRQKYDLVREHLLYGDSYLTNLTVKTEVRTPLSLREIFFLSHAPYKVLFEDSFLVFSPECFVRISKGRIFSFPMKGTIDAALPGAREAVLADPKEMAEHVTIVDLIRNDLSTVATDVSVTRFRYIDEIRTLRKNLLQVSSEICGDLPADYRAGLGDILVSLLPAGSISGAPKRKTVEIIRQAEGEPRGYYTGVVGIFDGDSLDSGVMIRYLERDGDRLYYRSGGGITVQSDPQREYQESIDKIYVPLD